MTNDPVAVKKLLRIKQKFVWGYKVLRKYDEGGRYRGGVWESGASLSSPYFDYYEWKPGVNKSNSRMKDVCTSRKDIYKGIHVYLVKDIAMREKDNYEVIVKVKCELKDLLGAKFHGEDITKYQRAVFRQVYLPNTEYCKAMGLPYRKRNRSKVAFIFDE
ncbi:hypothetical protein C4577_02175 [Candidatus Parcubacteria bacterium]|nr:MAG: hypothetical protein C4577_02175 [Candidatus Parcubacteria bacterium]